MRQLAGFVCGFILALVLFSDSTCSLTFIPCREGSSAVKSETERGIDHEIRVADSYRCF